MALDALGLKIIAPHLKGASILCLGYPDITARVETVKALLGVEPTEFTPHGQDHGVSWPLPETMHVFKLAGAVQCVTVDSMPNRGVEELVDLNVRQDGWKDLFTLVINPGTVEHCFDVAAAMFNAWRALAVGGHILHVAPVTMVNHGFWNVCPTALADFLEMNGGELLSLVGRDREGFSVSLETQKRHKVPQETVLYALARKNKDVAETMPVQGRFRRPM